MTREFIHKLIPLMALIVANIFFILYCAAGMIVDSAFHLYAIPFWKLLTPGIVFWTTIFIGGWWFAAKKEKP